jgi:hypothetical protein
MNQDDGRREGDSISNNSEFSDENEEEMQNSHIA